MTPPRLPRQLLRVVLPAHLRQVVLADMEEDTARIAETRGRRAAARWYWRQTLRSVPGALWARFMPILTEIPQDARYALRQWRRSPAFALTGVVTQATGIALATAVFAVAHAVLLRALPYEHADQLVQIFEGSEPPGLLSYQDFEELRTSTRAFSAIAGFSGGSRALSIPPAAAERIGSVEVTGGFFELLGVRPFVGRSFTELDTKRGAPPVVIVSHELWTTRLSADPAWVGRGLVLGGVLHTIIGVLPAGFHFPPRGLAALWLPLRTSPQQEQRGYWHWMDVIGRRGPGVANAQLASDLAMVAGRFAARDAKWHGTASLRARPLHDVIVAGVRPTILALLAGVMLVLLATCATAAGLLLSRASSRRREISVRAAIGANRGRLVRQLLVEAVVLSLVAGTIGVVGGYWLLRTFLAAVPAGQRAALPHLAALSIDPSVVLACLLLSIVTGIVFGILPALRTAGDTSSSVRARITGTRSDSHVRFALVAGQVAVAFVLLSGSLLLATSVQRLLREDPGFDPHGLVTFRLTLSGRYPDAAAVLAFQDRLRERIEGVAGVSGVALASDLPLSGRGDTGTVTLLGQSSGPAPSGPEASLRTVSASYFPLTRIPVLRGRSFTPSDAQNTPGVVMINALLADLLSAGGDPLGRRISFEFAPGPWEIVGVVGNERVEALDGPLRPVVYFHARQDPFRDVAVLARTTLPDAFAASVRGVVADLDAELPLFAIRSIDDISQASGAVFVRRAAMWMLALFAGAAVLLSALSLYGVLAQSVMERTREIAVRVALGATRGRIFAAVLRTGLAAAAVGLLMGAAVARAVSGLLTSLLYGVQPGDPQTTAASAALLGLLALAACVIPARRALRIDPAAALRNE